MGSEKRERNKINKIHMYRPRWRIIVVFVKAASSRRSKEEESIKVVEEVKLFHKKM